MLSKLSTKFRSEKLRNIIVALIDQALVSAGTFITAIIIARAFSVESFGIFSLGMGLVVLITSVQDSLISVPYNIQGPQIHGEDKQVYAGSVLIHQILLAVSFSVALLIAATLLFLFDSSHAHMVLSLCISISAIIFKEFIRRFEFENMSFMRALYVDLSVFIMQVGAMLICWQKGYLTLNNVFYIIAAPHLITCSFSLISRRTRFRFHSSRLQQHFP